MKMPWKLLGFAVVLCALAACKDQPVAPQATAQTAAIPMAADFMNNPDGGLPVVARYQQDNYVFAWSNWPANTVGAYHTTFPLSAALGDAWDDAVCGPSNPTPGLHLQEVAHWDHNDPSSVWIWNGVADVWIVLVDLTSPGPCDTRAIIASGWGKFHNNDNNATAAFRRPGIQDSWTYRAEGSLTTPAGARVQYNGLLHCVVPLPKDVPKCTYRINF